MLRLAMHRARHRDRLALTARQCADLDLDRRHVDPDIGERPSRAPPHLGMVEEAERPGTPELAVQKHVVVDAEPVDEGQVLVDALDAERAGLADRG